MGVTVAVTLLCLVAGRGASTAWAVLAVLSGQLFVGWTNDLLDAEVDRASGRLDKPLGRGQISTTSVALAGGIAGIACVPLSLANGIWAAFAHLVAVASATAYNLGLKRTAWSWAPYGLSFGLLPAFVTLGLSGHSRLPPPWAVAAAALLGVAGHLAQSLGDIDRDREEHRMGLPARLGWAGSIRLAGALLAAGALAVFSGGSHSHRASAALLVALALNASVIGAAFARRTQLAFRLTMLSALAVIAVFALGGDGF